MAQHVDERSQRRTWCRARSGNDGSEASSQRDDDQGDQADDALVDRRHDAATKEVRKVDSMWVPAEYLPRHLQRAVRKVVRAAMLNFAQRCAVSSAIGTSPSSGNRLASKRPERVRGVV